MRKLETTADLIRALEEKHDWRGVRAIARGLRIPATTVSSWRRGRSFPTEVHAFAIARALDIPAVMVLVVAAADRSPDATARSAWAKIARQVARGELAGAAVIVEGSPAAPPVRASNAARRSRAA